MGLPTPTEALFDAGAVTSNQGVWYYLDNVGHETSTNQWTWADLNDGQTDLAGYRGVVSENPFNIPNPQVLDWAYISGEHRWVRRNSSTWVYNPGPAAFDSRYRSQHAAERAGLVTVGAYIFSSSKHQIRIIRSYQGNVPGAGIYEWVAFQGPALDIEDWAFRSNNVRVQPRKLGDFPTHSLNQIPNDGEQWYTLRARVHKNANGTLTSYDLSDWIEEVVGGGGSEVTASAAAPAPGTMVAAQFSIDGTTWGLEAGSTGGTIGTYAFNLTHPNFASTGIAIPTTPDYLYLTIRNFDWDHDTQAVDRQFESSGVAVIDIAELNLTADWAVGDVVQTNPDAATDILRGMVGRLGNFDFQFAHTADGTLLMGVSAGGATSVLSGTLVVKF